jgi:hypothetical protein
MLRRICGITFILFTPYYSAARAGLLSIRQASVKTSAAIPISAAVVWRPSESRTEPSAWSRENPSASNVAEGTLLSAWQAEPLDARTPGPDLQQLAARHGGVDRGGSVVDKIDRRHDISVA